MKFDPSIVLANWDIVDVVSKVFLMPLMLASYLIPAMHRAN